jgi:H+-transporting ATPase
MSDYKKLGETAEEEHKAPSTLTPAQLEEMKTSENGLSSAEARRRLERDGPNALPEIKVNPCLKFLSYYWGPMPIMIWIAIIIELARQAWLDVGVLSFLQFINGFIGWHEEKNAGNAIEALKKSLALKARAKRDGKWDNIDARDLVIGDRVGIKLGDIIPADLQLGPGFAEIDQAALTGESLAVTRFEGDIVYQGSICKRGDLEAIVCATGAQTFFGKTSTLVASVQQRGNLQKILLKVAFALLIISTILAIIILIVVSVKGNDFLESLSFCVVLMVASIPIAMQVVCATTMAVGAHALAKRRAIVSRLSAIEELAGMSILCSDKTGTLTKNELTIQNPVLLKSFTAEDLFLVAGLAAKRELGSQDAIDKCVTEYGINKCRISYDGYEEENFIPFDPKIKRTEATVRNSRTGETFKATKGAPQVILAMCEDPSIEEEVSRHVMDLASRGYRTLGVARTNKDGRWSMIGLISLYDPPRDDTKETIQKALQMGLKVKMITGDQTAIAKETARLLNLGDKIYNSELLSDDATPVQRELLMSIIDDADGFAEVFPEHKYAIVAILQDRKKRVGMTGDGVNDAPALKKADVGIAVDGATDAARAAADIVLTLPGLSVIIEAVYRARKIFQRMQNYCIYRIACTLQLLIFFFISMVSIDPTNYHYNKCWNSDYYSPKKISSVFTLPVITLVIITILNDGTIISIAYDKVTVSKTPNKWNLYLIFSISLLLGGIAFFSSLIILLLGLTNMYGGNGTTNTPDACSNENYRANNPDNHNSFLKGLGFEPFRYGEVMTMIFLKICISNFLTVYSARCKSWFWTRLPGKFLLISTCFSMILTTILACYWYLNVSTGGSNTTPEMQSISWGVAAFIWVGNIIIFAVQDISKVFAMMAFEKYYAITGKDGGFSSAVLTDSFLIFNQNVRKSIVTRRSMAAAHAEYKN